MAHDVNKLFDFFLSHTLGQGCLEYLLHPKMQKQTTTTTKKNAKEKSVFPLTKTVIHVPFCLQTSGGRILVAAIFNLYAQLCVCCVMNFKRFIKEP